MASCHREMLNNHHARPSSIRVGFVPLVDCAPLVMAQELGLFSRFGLKVQLHREIGWATIRDKVIYGELHAAQAPAGLLVAANCGLGCIPADCLTGLVLNLHGNAITLSQALWREGVRDGTTLRQWLHQSDRQLTLGVVHRYSAHSYLLRAWLRRHRIDPDRDVQIVAVPPPQMPTNLKGGHLDGYCAGEPWNSVAVLARTGWIVATSQSLAPGHIEKVLMVRRGFALRSPEEHGGLVAALLQACEFCDRPENRERVIETLAQRRYVGVSAEVIRMSLGHLLDLGNGRKEEADDFHVFHRHGANEPTEARAQGVIESLRNAGLLPDGAAATERAAVKWFRMDVYERAQEISAATAAPWGVAPAVAG